MNLKNFLFPFDVWECQNCGWAISAGGHYLHKIAEEGIKFQSLRLKKALDRYKE
jgi:ribosomal protein L37AE/L43A